jgi:hypothetical protein
MMTMITKQDILKEKLAEYLKANKAEKGSLLDHLESITGFTRKAIVRRLSSLQHQDSHKIEKRGRKEIYGSDVSCALKEIWTLFNEICAERLHPQLGEYVRVLQQTNAWKRSDYTTSLLLRMSLATLKRKIALFEKGKSHRQGKGSTKPSDLKEIIPIRRGPWDNPPAGYGEVDSVAHCGSTVAGDYIFSIQYTDVRTIWTCLASQWNKGQHATQESFERIKSRLPFDLLAIDPDSGSEFINWIIKLWCDRQSPSVMMTRIRPYYKNDHARIEQKNYTNIRDFLGYTRLEDETKVSLMNELYDLLEDYINFFLPSQKCIGKERTGSKYKRVYDEAKTAYQRVLDDPGISHNTKQYLQEKYATLNPVVIKSDIDRLIKQIVTGTKYTPR